MATSNKPVPSFLKALGRKAFPAHIDLPRGHYTLVRVFKHDFFAATGLFQGNEGDLVVLKIGRQEGLLGIPLKWVGRFLAGREARIYQALQDEDGVPAFAGMWSDSAFAHDYLPGHPLKRDEEVADDFFDQLDSLIAEIHKRDMAYVDLEKCENIIVTDSGKPGLIDFQISWFLPGWWGKSFPPAVWFRKKLQHMDRYHLLKHRRRTRPDQLSEEEFNSFEPPTYIKLHRAMVKPLRIIRRGLLKKLDPDHANAPR